MKYNLKIGYDNKIVIDQIINIIHELLVIIIFFNNIVI